MIGRALTEIGSSLALLFSILTAVASPAVAQVESCIGDGSLVAGTITGLTRMHPNGSVLTAQGVRLASPQCAIALAIQEGKHVRVGRVNEIHLANANGRLTPLLGRQAAVLLRQVIVPHTIYHIGELISFEWDLVDARPGSEACRRFPNLC